MERANERKRVAVVTGASAGVGRAVATAFGRRGYRVAMLARSRAGLEGAFRDVIAAGGEPWAVEADVANPEAVFWVADRVSSEWGGADAWVNAAMETVVGPVDRILPEEYRRITEVTYLGYVYGTLAALRIMRPRDCGAIIQIGSAPRRARSLPRDRENRHVIAFGVVEARHQMCGARAAGGKTDAEFAGELGVRRRHERGHLLMPHLNEFDFSACALQGPQHAVNSISRIAEYPPHAPIVKPLHEKIADSGTHDELALLEP